MHTYIDTYIDTDSSKVSHAYSLEGATTRHSHAYHDGCYLGQVALAETPSACPDFSIPPSGSGIPSLGYTGC